MGANIVFCITMGFCIAVAVIVPEERWDQQATNAKAQNRRDESVCTERRLLLFRWIAVPGISLRAHAKLQCREYVPAPYSVASDAWREWAIKSPAMRGLTL